MHAKDLFIAYTPMAILTGFGLSKISMLRNNLKNNLLKLLILLPAIYMFSQEELVRITKALILFGRVADYSISQDLLILAAKIVICLLIFQALTIILLRFKPTFTAVRNISLTFFLLDISILMVTVYFFYSKFI